MTKTRQGLVLGLAAYLLWGGISLFWKQLAGVNAYASLSYRITWTMISMLLYMIISKRRQTYRAELVQLWQDKRSSGAMFLASFLIALNWLTYIYAVGHGQATQASLGYYIMPLFSVILSLIFLHEKLDLWTWLAVILASFGVGLLVLNTGQLPLITFVLALSFSLYGLIKKNIKLSSDLAMLVEAMLVFPLALIYLLFISKESPLDYSLWENFLLMISGLVTAIPLLLFAEGVKRAPLNQIGFIQYINPTIQLFIAVTVFGETITASELQGFALIWLAVLLFILGQITLLFRTKKKSVDRSTLENGNK